MLPLTLVKSRVEYFLSMSKSAPLQAYIKFCAMGEGVAKNGGDKAPLALRRTEPDFILPRTEIYLKRPLGSFS